MKQRATREKLMEAINKVQTIEACHTWKDVSYESENASENLHFTFF